MLACRYEGWKFEARIFDLLLLSSGGKVESYNFGYLKGSLQEKLMEDCKF